MSKIVGSVVSTPMRIPDWNQTNPNKSDYIKNKPDIEQLKKDVQSAKEAANTAQQTAENNLDAANGLIADLQNYANTTFAPVVRNEASGKSIKLTDISPIEHTLGLKVGGITRKCENLIPFPFASDSVAINGIDWTVNPDGSVTANGTAADNSFYPVMYATEFPNGKYSFKSCVTASGGNYYSYVIYNDGVYSYDYGGGVSFDLTTSNIQYVGLGVEKGTTVSNLVFKPTLAKGTEAFWDLRSSPVTEVERWGENIWDEEWESGYINLDSGFNGADANCSRSKNYISVKPSTTYYMYNGSWRGANDARIAFYNNDKQYLSYSTNKQFTTPSDCYYLKFYWAGTKYNNDICISENTPPETLTVPEAVQALDGYGDGINENCYNYVDFEKKQFVKRCKRLVFNGTEKWYENTNGQFITEINLYGVKPNSESLCNLYKFDKSETPTNTFFVGSAGIAFNTTFETTEEWKAYLAELYALGNPLTILCELATPEITDISNLLTNAKTLTSIYPETNIYTDNANGYLDVTYNADTKKYIDNKFAELQEVILTAINI